MSVSAVNSADWLYTNYLSTTGSSGGTASSNDPISANQSNRGTHDSLMQSIMQAFSQIGISMPSTLSAQQTNPTPVSGSSISSTGSAASTNQADSAHHGRHAFGKFMHDLFLAVESGSDSDQSSTSSAAASPYSGFSSKLEQLISQWGTESDSSSPCTTSSSNSAINTPQSDLSTLALHPLAPLAPPTPQAPA